MVFGNGRLKWPRVLFFGGLAVAHQPSRQHSPFQHFSFLFLLVSFGMTLVAHLKCCVKPKPLVVPVYKNAVGIWKIITFS